MMKIQVAITTTSFAEYDTSPLDLLKTKGIEVKHNPGKSKYSREDIIDFCSGCIGIIAGIEQYSEETLNALPDLKILSRCGAGMDSIDLVAARNLQIDVRNTPDAPTRAVAELTIGLILSLLRFIPNSDRNIRQGKWKKNMGRLAQEKVLGIVGYGRIGKEVAMIARAIGMNIIAYDIAPINISSGTKSASLSELLHISDIVSLHLNKSNNSNPLIGTDQIALMKQDAYIINTARGGLIDEEALYLALANGKLSGAALDTFEQEPYQGKLSGLENVVLTSHIGSYAKESRVLMEKQAVNNLLKGLEELTS